jgi:3-oxoacyl-[acyl-carrier-protein] synthase-1
MVYKLADNIISPLGATTEMNYQAVKSGISSLCRYDHLWGIPEPFTASLFSAEQQKQYSIDGLTRFESLAYCSVKEAIQHANIDLSSHRVVFILSTTKANVELLEDPTTPPSMLYPGISAKRIPTKLNIKTEPIVVCNACISGVSAIVLAMRLLESNSYDYAIVCGADVQNKFTVSGFQSLKALSEEACKPFDIERIGLNLGEAAATIILSNKDESSKFKRNWAIETGAIRNDAFHITSPSKLGDGAFETLKAVMTDETVEKLAFINAHGTGTLFNDQMESVAIEMAGLQSVPVNAYKGVFGHTLGAAGILETIISMASMDENIILNTRGYEEKGVSGKITITTENKKTSQGCFIKMISGFGGCNGAILCKDVQSDKVERKSQSSGTRPILRKTHSVRITPNGVSIDGLPRESHGEGMSLITDIYKRYLDDNPKYYKMDPLCRLGYIATELLLMAENSPSDMPRNDRAVVFFNGSSSIMADMVYEKSIEDKDNYFPSPSAFVYTLPNIVIGEIAIRNHYQGETSFYILNQRNDDIIEQVVEASFIDKDTTSMISGWLDYQDDAHFEADLFITEVIK